ncbi:MAG: hypothetical protein ACREI3_09575 [Nitrospirales bacterium]
MNRSSKADGARRGTGMGFRHPAKERCFEMWAARRPFTEIFQRINAREATIRNWILEWERGAQQTWDPTMPHRGGYLGQEQQ